MHSGPLRLALLAALACVTALALPAQASALERPQKQEIGLLFAQTAENGSLKALKGTDRLRLTLRRVHQTLWFEDHPGRSTGDLPTKEFARNWGGFGFRADPPNAALTLVNAKNDEDTVVLKLLHRPRFRERGNVIVYDVRQLGKATGNLARFESGRDRRIDAHFDDASLFIDDATAPVIGRCWIEPYANCRGARLFGVDFSGGNMHGADLSDAWLTHAKFDGTDLTSADLTHSLGGLPALYEAKLCYTTMPNGTLDNHDC